MAKSLGCCHRPAGKAEVGPAEHTADLEHGSAQQAEAQLCAARQLSGEDVAKP